MQNFTEVPLPPYSHYAAIIFVYEENGEKKILTVKDQDKNENRLNIKLPGGTNERVYENYMLYENAMLKDLENMKFERPALVKILKNERAKKKVMEEEYGEIEDLGLILRTMCIECLRKIGYYPLDAEPRVAFVLQKDAHTQYFLEINTLIDREGNEVRIPNLDDNFRPLDRGIAETRVGVPVNEYRSLIFSHKTAAEKCLLANGIKVEQILPPDPEDDEDDDGGDSALKDLLSKL